MFHVKHFCQNFAVKGFIVDSNALLRSAPVAAAVPW